MSRLNLVNIPKTLCVLWEQFIVTVINSGVFTHFQYLALQLLGQIPSWLADVVATWIPALLDRLIWRGGWCCFLQLVLQQAPCHLRPDFLRFHMHTCSKQFANNQIKRPFVIKPTYPLFFRGLEYWWYSRGCFIQWPLPSLTSSWIRMINANNYNT